MRVLSQYPLANYIGQIFYKPFSLGNLRGTCAPILLPWLIYGAATTNPALGVKIDLSSIATQLGIIRSVYIDNTGSDTPIYIYFPDTQTTIVCQPNCTQWAPAYTLGMTANIYGLGFFTGDIPTTSMLFTNLPIAPATNVEIPQGIELWKASNTISRGTTIYNTNYGAPALGDQFINVTLPINAGSQTQTVFNFGTGFIYLTNFAVWSVGDIVISANPGTVPMFFESTGTSGIFWDETMLLNSDTNISFEIFQTSGNFKLDGTQLWRVRVNPTNISNNTNIQFNFSFTTNPS
jgi:hypothetical protein